MDLKWDQPPTVALDMEFRHMRVNVYFRLILEAQRALGREEGLFVEPSSAAAMSAVMQLASRRTLDPDQTIVVVLTSGGLKDPTSSRTWMPPVPRAGDDFDDVLVTLREAYGLALDR